MRCFALAQALCEFSYSVTFAITRPIPSLEPRLQAGGIEIQHLNVTMIGSGDDANQLIQFAQQSQVNWIVLDGYQFDASYQERIKQAGYQLLLFDDYGHALHYYADLVLNQNLSADPILYQHRENDTQLLLGCSYTLLRQEFLTWCHWRREIPAEAQKILVTLGGGDPDNVTLKVLRALQQISYEDLEVIVIVGGANPHYEQLKIESHKLPFSTRLVKNAANMPELMAWADLAIAAGGSTNWELAFMGVPTVVITIADNQRDIAQKLDQMGVVINLGWHLEVEEKAIAQMVSHLLRSPHQRQSMSQAARLLIDGKGSKRVVEAIQALTSTEN